MYSHYDALIFDMDGTLVNSGQLHEKAWLAMMQQYGFPIDRPYMRSLAGVPTNGTIKILLEKYKLNLHASVEEMTHYKEQFVNANLHKYVQPTTLMDVVKKYHGIKPMAVGTGAQTEEAKLVMQICGFDKYIPEQYIVGSDQVKNPKPAPDIFLLCANLLGANPNNCVVFEDSQLGLQAAAGAGMVGVDVLVHHQIENDYFL